MGQDDYIDPENEFSEILYDGTLLRGQRRRLEDEYGLQLGAEMMDARVTVGLTGKEDSELVFQNRAGDTESFELNGEETLSADQVLDTLEQNGEEPGTPFQRFYQAITSRIGKT